MVRMRSPSRSAFSVGGGSAEGRGYRSSWSTSRDRAARTENSYPGCSEPQACQAASTASRASRCQRAERSRKTPLGAPPSSRGWTYFCQKTLSTPPPTSRGWKTTEWN